RPLELGRRRSLEQADGGKLEGARALLAEVEGLLPGESLLDERTLGLGRLLDHELRHLLGLVACRRAIEARGRRLRCSGLAIARGEDAQALEEDVRHRA